MGYSRAVDHLARTILSACTASAVLGCASYSVNLAPPHADRPWVPETTKEGEVRPSPASGVPAKDARDYALPTNERLEQLTPPPTSLPVIPIRSRSSSILRNRRIPSRESHGMPRADAALAVGIARSTYLPRLTAAVVGGFQASDRRPERKRRPGHFRSGSQPRDISNRSTAGGLISSLGLQWLLFDFGERSARVDAAKQVSVASNIEFTAVHQQVAYAVTITFYSHAAATQRLAMVEKTLANAKAVEAASEARLKQGQATAVDLAQARQATAQAELRLVQATGAVQSTYFELLGAMGISPRTRLRIADVSGRPMAAGSIELTETSIDAAIARRPDVLAAYANAKAAEASVRATRAEFFPKLFLSGNVAYAVGELTLTTIPAVGQELPTVNLSGTRLSGTVIGGISVPIYDGGVRSALHEQAKNRSASANATLRQAREQSVRQIVVADNALRTSLALFASASAAHEPGAVRECERPWWMPRRRRSTRRSSPTGAASARSPSRTSRRAGLLDARIAKADAYSAAQVAAATLAFATGAITKPP